MLVGDLIYSDSVDIECDYKVYCSGNLLADTKANGFCKLPCSVLDLPVKSISIKNGMLIIEV